MQRLIRRTERAARVAARQRQRRKEEIERGEAWERRRTRERAISANNENIKEAKKRQRIDWEAGPLAPRRDVGEQAENYGAYGIYDVTLPDKDPADRPKWVGIAEGDRVVVTQGRDKGRISYVESIDKKKNAVKVKDVNVIDVHIPDWLKREDGDDRTIVSQAKAIPLHHVKLVYPLPNPETGVPCDVIIDRLERVRLTRGEGAFTGRAIPGTSTLIPYPISVSRGKSSSREDYEADTDRITVDEKTFRPYLLYPPMPMSVIDELRNKYSRFRNRHDWEYVQKKQAEDEREEKRSQLGKTMRTPLQELAELRERQKKAEERELTDEQLARIGEVMAQERTNAKQRAQALTA